MRSFKNTIVALALANIMGFNLCNGLTVLAMDFSEEQVNEYLEETSSNFSANYTTIRNGDNLNTSTTITIPGSEYKNLILKNIHGLPEYKKEYSNYFKLSGLRDLTGKLVYTIKCSQPLTQTNLEDMISFSGNTGITLDETETKWITEGVQLVFNINWGNLLGEKEDCWLGLFEDPSNSAPDLNIDIDIRGLQLQNELKLGTTFTLSSAVNSYTITSPDNKKLTIKYDKSTVDDKGHVHRNPIEGTVAVKEKIESGLPKSVFNVQIGSKRVHSSNGNSSSNRPVTPSKPSDNDNDGNDIDIVLRLYNPMTGEHLFTSSAAERTHLVDQGWKNEYCEWNTPSSSDAPVYRLYNPNNGDHHYTPNLAEKNALIQLGWRYEGVPFYSATKEEGIPVYRMYNPNATGAGSHHYTSSKAECDALSNYGWNDEGVAWYGIIK